MEKFERFSCIFANRQKISSSGKDSRKRKRKRVHIPHSKRPKEFVVERNSKERQRVGEMTKAFENLKSVLPSFHEDKKPSRSEILRETIDYIHMLEDNMVSRDSSDKHVSEHRGCTNMAEMTLHQEAHMGNQFSTEDCFINNVLIRHKIAADQTTLEGYQSNTSDFMFKNESLENHTQVSFELMLDCYKPGRMSLSPEVAETCRHSRQTCSEIIDSTAYLDPLPASEVNNDMYSCSRDYYHAFLNTSNSVLGLVPLKSRQTDQNYNVTESRCSESVYSDRFGISSNKKDFSMYELETNNVDRIPYMYLNALKQRGNKSVMPQTNLNHNPCGQYGFPENKVTYTNTQYEHPRQLADITNRVGPYLDRTGSTGAVKGRPIESNRSVGYQRHSVYDIEKRAIDDVAYIEHEDHVFETERFYSIL